MTYTTPTTKAPVRRHLVAGRGPSGLAPCRTCCHNARVGASAGIKRARAIVIAVTGLVAVMFACSVAPITLTTAIAIGGAYGIAAAIYLLVVWDR